MARPRILFVDDEGPILDGLRLALRGQIQEWDLAFARSGDAALALLEEAPADIVVSDMRMPGMDGAELLSQVKRRWPHTVRLILSGQAEGEAVLRALSVTHQFLNKPLQTNVLKVFVHRAVEVQRLMHQPRVLELAGKAGELPVLPDTYTGLIRAIQDPKSSITDIAKVVERDPLVSVKVLQLVNSAYFGLAQEIGSVRNAISLLGPHVLLGMALASSVLEKIPGNLDLPGFLAGVQNQALSCCVWIRRLLPTGEIMDEAVTAALIHDLGSVLLAMAQPKEFRAVLDRPAEDPLSRLEAERAVFGATHCDLGAHLFGQWNLPLPIVEAVAFHHQPGLVREGDTTLLAALHGAVVLADCESRGKDALKIGDLEAIRRGGLLGAFEEQARAMRAGTAHSREAA